MTSRAVLFLKYVLLSSYITKTSTNEFEKSMSSSHFVDKTAMIKTLFENRNNAAHVMITCPKLFGKSVNLDMIKRFAEIEVDKNGIPIQKLESSNYKLFSNTSLRISQHKDVIDSHLAEYPVILFNLSLNQVEMKNAGVENILHEIRSALKATALQYKWLLDKLVEKRSIDKNTGNEKRINYLQKMLEMNLNTDEICISLFQLTEILYQYFEKKVIVLIDDYDAVINKGLFTPNFDSDKIIKIIQTMIVKLLEPINPYIEFSVITGVNGILYHFHFLEMKTISHHRFLSCPLFSFYFGFTNDEVNRLLDGLQIGQKQSIRNEIEKYYNGYTALGNLPIRTSAEQKLFNPYSIKSYLSNVGEHTASSKDLDCWTSTEPVARFLEQFMKASEFRKFILELLHEKVIFVKHMHNYYENELFAFKNLIDRNFYDISSFDVLTFLAFMFEYGYLSYTLKMNFYRIPNKEVEQDIRKYLSSWYKDFANVTKQELKSISDPLSDIINLEDAPDSRWNQFIQISSRMFKSIISKHQDHMPKRGNLQYELRSILYLAAIEIKQVKVGERLNHDFYENYPDTAKLVMVNGEGTAIIILITYEDNETLQEAVKYIKSHKLNVKQTIKCKKILSINLLRKDLIWETDYEVLFLQRGSVW